MITDCVIDIGTNSARLMLSHREEGRVVCDEKTLRTVRTGEGVNKNGALCEAAMERTVAALKEYRDIIDARAPGARVLCFATSAVRDARNRGEFIAMAKRRTGLDVRVLSGDEEARCGFAGAVGSGSGGIVDVGGGSTEVIFGARGKIDFARSLQLGCVRAMEMFPGNEAACFAYARGLFDALPLAPAASLPFYAVGGTATALAAMDQRLNEYDPARITGYPLRLGAMRAMLAEISEMDFERRIELAGLHPRRADVIGFGLAILLAFMEAAGIESVTASDADNMEGALVLGM